MAKLYRLKTGFDMNYKDFKNFCGEPSKDEYNYFSSEKKKKKNYSNEKQVRENFVFALEAGLKQTASTIECSYRLPVGWVAPRATFDRLQFLWSHMILIFFSSVKTC